MQANQQGWALFNSISNNKLDVSVSILDECRGDGRVMNYRNKYNETPLHEACLYGRSKATKMIIVSGIFLIIHVYIYIYIVRIIITYEYERGGCQR